MNKVENIGCNEWVEVDSHSYWNPLEHGAELIGLLMKKEETSFVDKQGKPRFMWTICENITDKEFKTPSHKVLENKLSNIPLGSMVKISFIGEKESKHVNPTKLYSVKVQNQNKIPEEFVK